MNSIIEIKESLLSNIAKADEAYQNNDYVTAAAFYLAASKDVKRLLPELDNDGDYREFKELGDYLSSRSKLMKDMNDSSTVDVEVREDTGVSFASFLGMDNIKEYLKKDIIDPWNSHTLHKRKKHGLFFYGPKGVSKTTFANALIHELHATGYFIQPFHYFNLADCPAMENQMRKIFEEAEKKDNVVFFIEQPAPFFPNGEDPNSEDTAELFLRIFKAEMKRVRAKKLNILFIATTSVPDKITEKAFCPALFDDFIHIDVPDTETRKLLVRKYLKNLSADEGRIVAYTDGLVTTDVSRLCRLIALKGEEKGSLNQQELDDILASFKPSPAQGFKANVAGFEEKISKFEIIRS